MLRVFLRVFLFLIFYSGTVVATLSLGSHLWPEGIGNEAEIIFWPATGVALFFVLRFGPGYATVILLSVLPAVVFAEDPPIQAILGASGNFLEVLIGWFLLTRIGHFRGSFESIRMVVALVLTSVAGGVASALYPIVQFATGNVAGEIWHGAVLRFAFANGCGTMIVCVFLCSLTSGRWRFQEHRREFLVWLSLSLLIISFAFNRVFDNAVNYAFLVYPLVVFAAIRYGLAECSLTLVLVIAGIYTSLIRFGAGMTEADVLPIIQFIQAFTWVLGLTGFFVAALMAERRTAQDEILEKKKRLLESDLQGERAKLEALRYQINPHFLFNSISSVCGSLPDRPGDARKMLAELADFLRSVLDHPSEDFNSLGNELDSIRRYVTIEQRRYRDDLDCEIDAEPSLLSHPIPVLILQPLVENAIRHGFRSKSDKLIVRVAAQVDEEQNLILEVINNGRWTEAENRGGIGLANIRKRLNMLYGDDACVEVIQEDVRVMIRIKLPQEPINQPPAT